MKEPVVTAMCPDKMSILYGLNPSTQKTSDLISLKHKEQKLMKYNVPGMVKIWSFICSLTKINKSIHKFLAFKKITYKTFCFYLKFRV